MKLKTTFGVVLLVFLALGTLPAAARELAGIALPESLNAGNVRLVLNGAGVRGKFMMDIYVAGLYLVAPESDAASIIDADRPMAIRLHIVSTIVTGTIMEKNTRDGFNRSTGGDTSPIRAEIETFISVFKDKIRKNDVFDIVYAPDQGVVVFKNGTRMAQARGLSFKKALFGIWIKENVPFPKLRNGMLGRK